MLLLCYFDNQHLKMLPQGLFIPGSNCPFVLITLKFYFRYLILEFMPIYCLNFLSLYIYPSQLNTLQQICLNTFADRSMKKPNWYKIQPFHSNKPIQRWGHSSCVVQNDLVIFGGYADSSYMNDVWIFNTITLQWQLCKTTGDIPEPRSNATFNYDKQHNRFILFGGGGLGKKRFNSIFILDWNTKKWKQIEPNNYQNRPWERTYHISQIIGDYLVIFGGENFADLNDAWLFDLKQLKWQQIVISSQQKKPCPRRFHISVLRNNELIVIGGCHNKYRSLKDVFKMDFNQFLKAKNIEDLSWEEIKIQSSDFIPRWGHSSTYNPLNDKVYIFGGRFSNDLQDILMLDIDKRVSKKISVSNQSISPCPRRRHSANFIGSSLLVFGGFNGSYFNDLYSISIPSQNPLPKYTKDSVILFSELLSKQFSATVSFFGNYIKQFGKLYSQYRQKFTQLQLNEILTSIISQYALFPGKYDEEMAYLQKNKGLKIFSSKQLKVQAIRFKYGMSHALQQKITEPFIFMQKNQNSKVYPGINQKNAMCQNSNQQNQLLNKFYFNHPHQTATQIVFLGQKQFQRYLQDQHKKIYVQKQCQNTNKEHKNINFQSQTDQLTIYLQGIGHLNINSKVKYTNSYFQNCFKDTRRIAFKDIDKQHVRVFQVAILFAETLVLVVPKNFQTQEWKNLAQLGGYLCIQNLNEVIQKHFVSKADSHTFTQLIYMACSMRMTRLMSRCSSLIIQREQQKFFHSQSKKITPKLFEQFQNKFFHNLQNFLYPPQFQKQITFDFSINKLNIVVRNFHQMKMNSEKGKNKNLENQEKQNEENVCQ